MTVKEREKIASSGCGFYKQEVTTKKGIDPLFKGTYSS